MRFPYHGAGIGLVKDNCLLCGKRSDHPFHGMWSIPGGRREKSIDKDEFSNAKREFREETGVDFMTLQTKPICSWTLKVPFFSWTTYFFSVSDFDDKALVPNEFFEISWVPFDEILGKSRGKGKKKHFRPFSKSEVRSVLRNL